MWPVTEAKKTKPSGDAPLSKDDKKFIKDHTTKKDDKKSGGGGDDFNSKHPRAAAGSAAGGQFAPGGGGSSEDDAKKEKGGKGKGGKEQLGRGKFSAAVKKEVHSAGLAYKAGYDKKGGSPQVKGLQSKLNKLGLTDASGKPLAVDGKLGPKTTAAIKKAQKRLGMKPTGKADGAFLDKLRAGDKGKSKKGPVKKLAQMKVSKPGDKRPASKRPASKTDKRPLAGSVGQGTRKGVKSA